MDELLIVFTAAALALTVSVVVVRFYFREKRRHLRAMLSLGHEKEN